MPRPVGTDRLDVAAEGRLVLFAEQPKDWRGRTAATRTSVEHPGTAIRWEDELWEVVAAVLLPGGGVRYELTRWDTRHAARHVTTYDEASEALRSEEARRDRHRAAKYRRAFVLSPLLGHLPSAIQQRIEDESAFPATVLTIVSAAPFFVLGVVALVSLLAAGAGGAGLLPTWAAIPGVYFLVESAARLSVALAQGRPIGSFLGEAWVAVAEAVRTRSVR